MIRPAIFGITLAIASIGNVLSQVNPQAKVPEPPVTNFTRDPYAVLLGGGGIYRVTIKDFVIADSPSKRNEFGTVNLKIKQVLAGPKFESLATRFVTVIEQVSLNTPPVPWPRLITIGTGELIIFYCPNTYDPAAGGTNKDPGAVVMVADADEQHHDPNLSILLEYARLSGSTNAELQKELPTSLAIPDWRAQRFAISMIGDRIGRSDGKKAQEMLNSYIQSALANKAIYLEGSSACAEFGKLPVLPETSPEMRKQAIHSLIQWSVSPDFPYCSEALGGLAHIAEHSGLKPSDVLTTSEQATFQTQLVKMDFSQHSAAPEYRKIIAKWLGQ